MSRVIFIMRVSVRGVAKVARVVMKASVSGG